MPQLPVRSATGGGDPEAKRRKIRKGTHSCWECRRRKTRCQYASDTAAICIGCQARGTNCVSQEFPNEQSHSSERGLSQRMNRVEGMLERIIERITPGSYNHSQSRGKASTSSASVEDELEDLSPDILRPSAADHPHVIGIFDALREEGGSCPSARTSFVPTPASTQSDTAPGLPVKFSHISKTLHATFPCQHDIDAIVKAVGSGPYFIAAYFTGIDGPFEDPSTVSEVPPPTSHPALLSKRLMQLINCMQKISVDAIPKDLVSKEPMRLQMNRIVNVVLDLVASDDDLVGSVEGLETLCFVALYHANAGNLRKSWLALRRALAVAQLMGVDRWPNEKPMKSVDPQSDPRTRTRAGKLWYRINFTDRYLSLLLGLSAASEDDSFAEPIRIAGDTPVERLEKLHTVVTGAIIKRNMNVSRAAPDSAFGTTQAIDCDLEMAAKSMGAEWWQPLQTFDTSMATPLELVRAHAHVMMQMNHHHLLILLHLPYMMRDPKERRWDYSKTTCLHASRELLHAYLVFRHLTDAASACRHTDYGALTAAMTLLLGYLDPKLRVRDVEISERRNADRDVIVKVRDVMKVMAARDGDKLAHEASDIITRLLPLADVDLTMSGLGENDAPVRLEIPYLGTININPVRRQPQHNPRQDSSGMLPSPTNRNNSREECGELERLSVYPSPTTYQAPDNPDHMPMDMGLQQFPQAQSSFLSSLGEDANFSFMQFEPDISSPYQFPELAADVDQWTFQGFDATFFENLLS
ncbi:uncharacterized protein GGS22DRAFT_161333 [Annulohypoxylon maeteangense]|uniref:uncharacterized protein n=1 Tax=Annulohypoxylon maeteangense TaxID=1927788 RepID=UPI00200836AD|nr:uncharacterized protein GGS22DRAFT_161333 [Annulohypoxylon maeteangense]KAI0885608.1 hypothetical protein GGS22DRAFT_161333 [Annulohypoxylon maeteangense]